MKQEFLEIVEAGLGYPLIDYTFSKKQLHRALTNNDILQPALIPNPEEEIQILFPHTDKPKVIRILGEIGVVSGIKPLRLSLVFEDNLLRILWVWGERIHKTDLPIMSISAKQIGISMKRARLFREVQDLALTDPLTGLNNRRSLFELGKIEFSRSIRTNSSFCCMMLDLDHFKQVNDTYGHLIGDQVLQEFSRRARGAVRASDLLGRYGGEELIIFLPETELETA